LAQALLAKARLASEPGLIFIFRLQGMV